MRTRRWAQFTAAWFVTFHKMHVWTNDTRRISRTILEAGDLCESNHPFLVSLLFFLLSAEAYPPPPMITFDFGPRASNHLKRKGALHVVKVVLIPRGTHLHSSQTALSCALVYFIRKALRVKVDPPIHVSHSRPGKTLALIHTAASPQRAFIVISAPSHTAKHLS